MQSPFNASGYFTVYGDESLHNDHFNARLTTGDSTQTYARTGYLGFLRRTESVQADGGTLIIDLCFAACCFNKRLHQDE